MILSSSFYVRSTMIGKMKTQPTGMRSLQHRDFLKTLRYLGHRDCIKLFCVTSHRGHTTTCKIIHETTQVSYDKPKDNPIHTITQKIKKKIAEQFHPTNRVACKDLITMDMITRKFFIFVFLGSIQ